MAYCFSFDVECGATKESALAIRRHFEGWRAVVPEADITSIARTAVWQDKAANWWCSVMASGVSIGSPQNDDITSEIHILTVVLQLYERLKSIPGYRYAAGGFEITPFDTYSQMLKAKGAAHEPFEGLILATQLWKELEQPEGYVPFAEGFVWFPMKSSLSKMVAIPMI
ncbi:MAG: hypothetical protein ACO1QS_14750 [Verrucomicrobiota bacterium]